MPTIEKQVAKPRPTIRPKAESESAWDFLEGIKQIVYGQPASGKTSYWATFDGPILACICSGGNKSGELKSVNTPEYKKKIDARIISDMGRLEEIIMEEAQNYTTVVIDHMTALQDVALREVLGLDELPVSKMFGLARIQDYQAAADRCKKITKKLLELPANIVVVTQERTYTPKDLEENSDVLFTTIGPSLFPKLAEWVMPLFDFVNQIYVRPRVIEETKEVKIGKETHMVTTRKRIKGEFDHCLRSGKHDIYVSKFRKSDKTKILPECIVDPDYTKLLELSNS